MANEVVQQLENSPLPTLIERLAVAVADAQFAMDRNSVAVLQEMARSTVDLGDGTSRSMLDLGLVPSFYHFSEYNIEARVAFSSAHSREISVGGSIGIDIKFFSASINASYTSKYSFHSEGSSTVNTRVVSVPPPAEITALIGGLKTESGA